MVTVAESITLKDAVRKSKSINATSYFWITEVNVLNLEIPEDQTFGSIGVVWNNFTETCTAHVNFLLSKYGVIVGLRNDDKLFSSLEELRDAHPKLFEVPGEFSILTN